MNPKKRLTAIVIHIFAGAHAASAALLAQTMVGDEAVLTALTVAMILAICRIHGMSATIKNALGFLGILAGFYVGTRTAMFLIKWMPAIGNGANAISTVFTTEVIGWAVYALVSTGRSIDDVTKQEADELIRKGKEYRRENIENKRKIKKTIIGMSESDKSEYHRMMEQLKSQDLSEEKRDHLLRELDDLFKKYEGSQS